MSLDEIKKRCAVLIGDYGDQEGLSKILGVSRSTVAHYATERSSVQIENLETFCSVMGVSVQWLITGREHPLVEAYLAATPDDRRLADKVLGTHWEQSKKAAT